MLCGIGGNLSDRMPQVQGVDVDRQVLVRILHDVAGVGILVFRPALHTLRLKHLGKIAGLSVDLHHLGL